MNKTAFNVIFFFLLVAAFFTLQSVALPSIDLNDYSDRKNMELAREYRKKHTMEEILAHSYYDDRDEGLLFEDPETGVLVPLFFIEEADRELKASTKSESKIEEVPPTTSDDVSERNLEQTPQENEVDTTSTTPENASQTEMGSLYDDEDIDIKKN